MSKPKAFNTWTPERQEEWKKKIAEYGCKYREANKKKIAESRRKHYEANKEKLVEYRREYREANKEEIAEKDRERYAANPGESAEKNRQNRQKQRELRDAAKTLAMMHGIQQITEIYNTKTQ